ncbi:hypothetical protein H0H93_007979 [Arthromyces matolae]|nr:hypothetical protein H0H93_007979 [Arthromyces matolae]
MFPNTYATPHRRPYTNPLRPNFLVVDSVIVGEINDFLGEPFEMPHVTQRRPPDYPEDFYFNPPMEGPFFAQYNPMNSSGSPPDGYGNYGNVVESHWVRDADGQVVSTMGQIQVVPSDADTADLENLESIPLPPNSTPPPPPVMRSARLPSMSPPGGASGRTSRMGSLVGSLVTIPETESSDIDLLRAPGIYTRMRNQNLDRPNEVRRLRDLLVDSPRSTPQPQFFPDRPLFSSPLPTSSPELIVPLSPQSSEAPNRMNTFSPFRTATNGRQRAGSSLNPPLMHFEPQSTSSPPPTPLRAQSRQPTSQNRAPSTSMPSHPAPHPPRGTADAPPPRQTTRGFPSYEPSQPNSYPEVNHPGSPLWPPQFPPVNLPNLYEVRTDVRHDPFPNPQHEAKMPLSEPDQVPQAPQDTQRSGANIRYVQPPPLGPTTCSEPLYPHGYVPYYASVAVAQGGGYICDGHGLYPIEPPQRIVPQTNGNRMHHSRVDPQLLSKDGPVPPPPPPPPPPRAPLEPLSLNDHLRMTDWSRLAGGEDLRLQGDTLQTEVIGKHWANLDSHFRSRSQTDHTLADMMIPHMSVCSRIRRSLDKLLELIAKMLFNYGQLQYGTERWHGSWRKNLSSLERTTKGFCDVSILICSRDITFTLLEKTLSKLTHYESKFRDLTKKINYLVHRLRLRELHAALSNAHSAAEEQLKSARSKRDLPRWDEEKMQREGLRKEFISLQNRLALSRRESWASSSSHSRRPYDSQHSASNGQENRSLPRNVGPFPNYVEDNNEFNLQERARPLPLHPNLALPSMSWQADPSGNVRYVGPHGNHDFGHSSSQAQTRLAQPHPADHRYRETEPLPPNTTPPPTPFIDMQSRALPDSDQELENINYREPAPRMTLRRVYYTRGGLQVAARPWAKLGVSVGLMEEEAQRQASSNHAGGVRSVVPGVKVSYKEFKSRYKEIEKRFSSQPNHPSRLHLSSSPSSWDEYGSGKAHPQRRGHATGASNGPSHARSKPPTRGIDTRDLQRKQRRSSIYANVPVSNPPTCYTAFHCLGVVESALDHLDAVGLENLKYVEDALLALRDCLQKQRTYGPELWKERSKQWGHLYLFQVNRMRRIVELIDRQLDDPHDGGNVFETRIFAHDIRYLIFKNQAMDTRDKPQHFVNDLLRTEFHKKFMSKFIK